MFKPGFTRADIHKMLEKRMQVFDQMVVSRLMYIGEQFVRNARESGNYNDVTGNLRSSVGYAVLKHGSKVAGSEFEPAGNRSDTGIGARKGKSLIEELSQDFPNGYVLIVVAGMEYAASVESRGKDVLTGSSYKAKEDLRKAIERIKAKMNQR